MRHLIDILDLSTEEIKAILDQADEIIAHPEEYREQVLSLRPGMHFPREQLIKRLVGMQYSRSDIGFDRNNFRVREGIVLHPVAEADLADLLDVEQHALADALRLDKLAALFKEGDALGQLVLDVAQRLVALLLARDVVRSGINRRVEQPRVDLAGDGVDAADALEPYTLLDYFPPDFLMFVDESHVTVPQVRGMSGGDTARKKNLIDYGFRLPSAFDNRPLKFEEVESKLNQMIFVSATPGDYERQNSTQVAQQVIRPTGLLDPLISVRPVEGQVVDLLGEINTRIQRHERVLVTTLTKKMAEDLTDYLTEQGIKVKYMHHEVDTFERMEIIKDLRLGSIDVVVGINLLREGLDLPEVSLVAILDADKEGFLRSETSLIQTIGRAARNAEGLVIMYADVVTDSMDRAITETERRRAIQMAYNKEHGIVPKTIVKAIADSIEISDKAENAKLNTRRMGRMEREAAIERLTREMKEAAKLLEFEHAAFLRDQIDRLRRGENPTVDSAAETERKQNHSQTQRKGRKYLGKR